MNCKSCSGPLVMRETYEYPLDDNGVYEREEPDLDFSVCGIYCQDCGAGHDYEVLNQTANIHTIALTVNSDPEPVALVAIGFRMGQLDTMGADKLIGVVAVDEDREEVGQYLARPNQNSWWERMQTLRALIPKGEHRTSFKEEEDDKTKDKD